MAEVPKSHLRWFQYSLRTLLLAVLLVSVSLAWLRVKMNRAREQRDSVKALGLDHSGMYYAHEHEGQTPTNPPPGFAWLRTLLGDDLFRRPDWVNLNGVNLSEPQWQHLARLTSIRVLYLCDARLRDEDLANLRDFSDLEELHLQRTDITDAGLFYLTGLRKLRKLDLWDTNATPEGVNSLRKFLPRCEIEYNTPAKFTKRLRDTPKIKLAPGAYAP